jgi:hypothetical protein
MDVRLFEVLGAEWTYYASWLLLPLSAVAVVVVVWRYLWPWLYGRPLSGWIRKHRRDPTQEETRALLAVRKVLSTLAHDVLKHRLLGLVSLVQSLDAPAVSTDGEPAWAVGGAQALEEDPTASTSGGGDLWAELRQELLRLCGARAAPRDRLWTRWGEAFVEVRRISGGKVAHPWIDARFRRADLTLKKLRDLIHAFIAGEREVALSAERIRRLGLDRIGDVHGDILALAEGCRPQLSPERVVQRALSALSALADRAGATDRVEVTIAADGEFLADLPPRLISTCLERFLDNALRLSAPGAPLALRVDLEQDDLLGDDVLIFRVLDGIPQVPRAEDFGAGLREMQRALAEFDCGMSFDRLHDPALTERGFVKEARLTVAVRRSEPLDRGSRAWGPLIKVWAPLALLWVAVGALSVARVLGGAPVKFAGGGDPVVEFRTEVGQALQFPLCEGGSDPRVEVVLEHGEACSQPGCRLSEAIGALAGCAQRLSDPRCPGVFTWTPAFEEGSRRGTSYELLVTCRAFGPPASEDTRRIRLVVNRPNTGPRLDAVQLQGEDEVLLPLESGQPMKVAAASRLVLIASANDADGDALRFTLTPAPHPGGVTPSINPIQVYQASSGYARLVLDEIPWSPDGTFVANLLVSDDSAEPVAFDLRLEAARLRPVRLEKFDLRATAATPGSGQAVSCVGGDGDSDGDDSPPTDTGRERRSFLMCQLGEQRQYQAALSVWFDPLLDRVEERLSITAADESTVDVIAPPRAARALSDPLTPQAGQTWQIQARGTQKTLARLRLSEVPLGPKAGPRRYTFDLDVAEYSTGDPQAWTLLVSLDEASERTHPMRFVLVLTRVGQGSSLKVTTNQVKLYEYEHEHDAFRARETVNVMLLNADTPSRTLATPILECGSPELTKAFESPYLDRISANAWRLHLSLRPGCIEGLGGPQSPLGNPTARTCRVELNTTDGKERAQVDVRVEDRLCRPLIQRLDLADPSIDTYAEGDPLSWLIEITDPDGDLLPQDVTLKAPPDFKLTLNKLKSSPSTKLHGTISGHALCGEAAQTLSIEVRDRSGLIVTRSLSAPTRCQPTLTTDGGQTLFEVTEGQRLTIPILGAPDDDLSMRGDIGKLSQGQFSWRASCERGPGPHILQFTARANGKASDPLQLEVLVKRCQINLLLEEEGTPIPTDAPYVRPVSGTRLLRIIPDIVRPQDLDLQVYIDPPGDQITLWNVKGSNDLFYLRCRDKPEARDLVITAKPNARLGERYRISSPLRIPVRCVE